MKRVNFLMIGLLIPSMLCQMVPDANSLAKSRVSAENRFKLNNFIGRSRASTRPKNKAKPSVVHKPVEPMASIPESEMVPVIKEQFVPQTPMGELTPIMVDGTLKSPEVHIQKPVMLVNRPIISHNPPYLIGPAKIDIHEKTQHSRHIPLSHMIHPARPRFPIMKPRAPMPHLNGIQGLRPKLSEPTQHHRYVPLGNIIAQIVARRQQRLLQQQRQRALAHSMLMSTGRRPSIVLVSVDHQFPSRNVYRSRDMAELFPKYDMVPNRIEPPVKSYGSGGRLIGGNNLF